MIEYRNDNLSKDTTNYKFRFSDSYKILTFLSSVSILKIRYKSDYLV